LRDAANKKYIISQVASKTDITIKLINGVTEAKFGYYGALYDKLSLDIMVHYMILKILFLLKIIQS